MSPLLKGHSHLSDECQQIKWKLSLEKRKPNSHKKSPLPCRAGGIVHANFTPLILMSNGTEDFWSATESDIEIRLIRAQLRAEYRQRFNRKQFD